MAKYIHKQAAIHALVNEANIHNSPIKRAYTRAAAIIEQITAEDVQPMKWISCKDKMPEDNTSVLFVYVSENGVKSVHYGYHTTIRGIYSGWSKTSGGWEYSDEDVTHWQPIPEPPKDGDTD